MTEIEDKYQELGGERSFLGRPLREERVLSEPSGRYRHYERGSIYWSSDTGAHEVHGAIREKWRQLGWERSFLKFPITDESPLADRVGRSNHFQGGSIYWHPSTGAHEIHGAIRAKWHRLGSERSILGYPTTDERTTPDRKGRFNHFQRGSIYWHPSTGAFEVHGAIRQKWSEMGWENGYLGYPISDELSTKDNAGRYSIFQGGIIIWNRTQGARILPHSIYTRWKGLNFSSGPLGNIVNSSFQDSIPFQIFPFENGHISSARKTHEPLEIYAQNMALLVAPATYGGQQPRFQAVDTLIRILRARQYGVVGLSEVFKDKERRKIKDELREIYPFSIEGPEERGIKSDGGLMLLSKYRITESNTSVFRVANHFDGMASKGIIHARIEIPGQGITTNYDLYLSHTQDPKDGKYRETVNKQLSHIQAFIQVTRDPLNTSILMGDLNTDARDPQLAEEFKARLNFPMDSWVLAGDTDRWPHGITSDAKKSFKSDHTPSRMNDPRRHQQGSRIDFILAHSGKNETPIFSETRIVQAQTAGLRDFSDHYGVRTEISSFDATAVGIGHQSIQSTTMRLNRITCLKRTSGYTRRGGIVSAFATGTLGSGVGIGSSRGRSDDEVHCTLSVRSQNLPDWDSLKSNTKHNVKDASSFIFNPSPSRVINSPQEWVEIKIQLKEWDRLNDDIIGGAVIRLTEAQLRETIGAPTELTFPLLTGENSEYVVTVIVEST